MSSAVLPEDESSQEADLVKGPQGTRGLGPLECLHPMLYVEY